jgi:hypothetical protein
MEAVDLQKYFYMSIRLHSVIRKKIAVFNLLVLKTLFFF